jgi:phenylacetate-CoA ligase
MGETLSEETRGLAETLTGAVVLDTYSSSEVGRIATQVSPQGPYLVNNFSLIVEVLDEEGKRCSPGESGRVVITDLQNYATPLVRYDTGDWAIPEDMFHQKLQRIKGRSRNMIRLPDGRKVWPLVGYREFSQVLPIRQFHVRQVSLEKLGARFFVDQLPNEEEREKISEIIRKSLDYDFEIEASYQTHPLSRGTNGKLEDFVSLIDT